MSNDKLSIVLFDFLVTWFGMWVYSTITLVCSLISVVTLCIYRPTWNTKFAKWIME